MAKLNKDDSTNLVTVTKDVQDTDIKVDFEKKDEALESKNMDAALKDRDSLTETIDLDKEDTTLIKFVQVKMYHIPGPTPNKQIILNNILYEIQRNDFQISQVQWVTSDDVCITVVEVTEDGKNYI